MMLLSQFLFTSYQTQNRMPHFVTQIHNDYSHADCDNLQDHLRDTPWEDIFKLSGSAAASEFCGSGFRLKLMYISLIVTIRSRLTHFHGFQLLVLLS